MDAHRIIKGIKRKLYCYSLFYPKKEDNAVKWAVIGLGNMAEVFASALDADADSKIVAVASRSLEKAKAFASRHGKGRAYGSYEDMLTDASLQIDLVYVATPAKYHAKHIEMCLEAGKNVLCEKPITMTSEQLLPLMIKAKDKGLFLMEGMWMKCLPTFKKATEWVKQGLIGNLELVKADFYKREIVNPELSIFNAAEGGGLMHDYGVYAIAFASTFLADYPDIIRFHKRESSFNIDSDWMVYAEKDGRKAIVNMSSNFNGLSKAALIGSNGLIEFEAQFNRTNKIVLYDKYGTPQDSYSVKYKNDGFEYEIAEVNHCIKEGKNYSELVPLQQSLDTCRIIDYLLQSEKQNDGIKR